DQLAASALPNPVGSARVAPGQDQPAGRAGGGFQGLAARMGTVLQPLVRGFETLGGHLRTLFRSIFTLLSGPRGDSGMVGLRGAAGAQPEPDRVGPSAGPATMPDGRLELWDLALKIQSEDRLPIREPDGGLRARDGTAGQDFVVLALMALALREGRRSPLGPLRRRGSASPNLPRRERTVPAQAGKPDLLE